MEQIIRSRLDRTRSREENIHQIREFLQLLILRIINEINYFQYISFVGGSSLRLVYQLQRFSEDLDFSMTQKHGYNFKSFIESVEFHLRKAGLDLDVRVKEQKVVHNAYFKFVNLLQQFNLSRTRDEKLMIRVEIDSNPPLGWKNEMTLINDIFIFPVWHFDLPSLFATKLHACFYRKYRKGRDFYDLMWYLSKKVTPNFILLNNAILQTEKKQLQINSENFKQFLFDKLEQIDFSILKKDVAPFLINRSELELMDKDIFKRLVNSLQF